MRVRISKRGRLGLSLLEVLVAVILASIVAMSGWVFVRTHGATANDRSCQAHVARLQNDVELFMRETGKTPDKMLESIRNVQYGGAVLPACPQHPVTDRQTNYRWGGSKVICGYHPEP